MNDKKLSVIYTAYLHLKGYGIVDLAQRNDELLALEAFDDLVDEANLDTFGEGIYEVSLMKDLFDDKGHYIKGKRIKYIQIDRGDEL